MQTYRYWSRAFGVMMLAGAILAGSILFSAANDLVVHEWGTFTSLQDEQGRAIGGINTDDEPVPAFVHRLARFLLLSPTQVPPVFFQGAPRCHPDVTMRLETPVIYFHTAAHKPSQVIDAHVAFRGGWLSEYYPNAKADAPGLSENDFKFGPLRADTVSSLTWKNLKVGVEGSGPATSEHVWTAPRNVEAAMVETDTGEKEKFLFYRGVAHLDSPLRVSRDGNQLEFRSQLDASYGSDLSVTNAWLVHILADGKVAFRSLPAMNLMPRRQHRLAVTSAEFAHAEYNLGNLARLKQALREALVREGLFLDEADALLNTWELSYFKSAGLRVFYLVPKAWTDTVLPLKITGQKADRMTRVMVGRVELVTREQRRILRQLASMKSEKIEEEARQLRLSIYEGTSARSGRDINKLFQGLQTLADQKVKVPASYQMYLDLGRFRNALILEQQRVHPTETLQKFINLYGLEAYAIPGAGG